jgi:hypothetical protein
MTGVPAGEGGPNSRRGGFYVARPFKQDHKAGIRKKISSREVKIPDETPWHPDGPLVTSCRIVG